MSELKTPEYTYLKVPPAPRLRSCAGLILAGMAIRARIGVGGLEEAAEILESYHSEREPTHYRFSADDRAVIAEVEDRTSGEANGESRWRTVVELVS